LWQNENLISDRYFEKFAKNGSSFFNTFSNAKVIIFKVVIEIIK